MGNKPLYDVENRIFDAGNLPPFIRDIMVSAIMLFPESEQDRHTYLVKTAIIKAAIEENAARTKKVTPSFKTLQKELGDMVNNVIFSCGGWQNAAHSLLAGQQADFETEVFRARRNGTLAGWVLYQALVHKISISKAAGKYCEIYQEGNGYIERFYNSPISYDEDEGNLANHIYKNMKSVAHLWAACCEFEYSPNTDKSKTAFYHEFDNFIPNSEMDIPGGYASFCMVAERHRAEGIKFKPPHAPAYLLPKDASWQIIPPPSDFYFVD
jgi:hypothetical protein